MKKIFFAIALLIGIGGFAQDQSAKDLYETAKKFMREGDYDNASLVLNTALQKEPNNYNMQKDAVYLFFLKKDYAGAVDLGKRLMEQKNSDEEIFQIVGMTYKAIADYKECSKIYKKANKKFPNSGVIYNEWGELEAMNKNIDGAIEYWEKGIEVDPNYSSNYYNAAMYYSNRGEVLFPVIIYGEIFVNLESYTARTADIKSALFDAYKKLYMKGEVYKALQNKKTTLFERSVLETLTRTVTMAAEGITPNQLMAIRTRFVLDWYANKNNLKYPFRLFDNMQFMLKEGFFDAYNQWIFGAAADVAAYDNWVNANDKQANSFKEFQHSRVFKMTAGQFYMK